MRLHRSTALLRIVAVGLMLSGWLMLDRRRDMPLAAPTAANNDAKPEPAESGDTWPVFRGNARATGVATSKLPAKLDVLWKFAPERASFEATAVIADGRVFVGSLDGELFALNLKTGEKLWEFKTEGGFHAAAAVRRDCVFAGDADGKMYCLAAANGELLWTYEGGAEIDGGPNFFKDTVLFGSQDANLYCLKCDNGELVWKHTIGDQIRCSPTVIEDRAFLAGCDGVLHMVDLNTGESVGDGVPIEAPTGCTPAAGGDQIYFGGEGETFFCVDWKKSQIAWRYRSEERHFPYRSSAALTDKLVIVGGRDKYVRAFHLDGQEAWEYSAKTRVDSSPVVVGDRLFVGLGNGKLVALALDSGKELWSYEAGGDFSSSPAVASGRLVIGNANGTVYCFGGK
ncbi:MAG: PQQ-binding-like beta-propeller repeat protein [Pirellulales bacterium]